MSWFVYPIYREYSGYPRLNVLHCNKNYRRWRLVIAAHRKSLPKKLIKFFRWKLKHPFVFEGSNFMPLMWNALVAWGVLLVRVALLSLTGVGTDAGLAGRSWACTPKPTRGRGKDIVLGGDINFITQLKIQYFLHIFCCTPGCAWFDF